MLTIFLAGAIFPQTVNLGHRGDADLKATVLYQRLNNSGNTTQNPAVKLGNANLTSPLVTIGAVNWLSSTTTITRLNPISFNYTGTQTQTTVPTNQTATYGSGNLGELNYIAIELRASQDRFSKFL